MHSYKIESFVPEENFYQGKDARFWRAVYENCFVIDVQNNVHVIASCRGDKTLNLTFDQVATIQNLFDGSKEFLILPTSGGTLLVYPAWQHLGFALAFLLNENAQEVEETYQKAQRYAFSTVFDADNTQENNHPLSLENKLSMLCFYMECLFDEKKSTNATAHILMIANLIGCRLHKVSVSSFHITLDEEELERFGAFLFCVFMTMRQYNGKVSALPDGNQTHANLQHVSQEYGLRIEQSIKERIAKPTAFDLPSASDVASFVTHPVFKKYRTEEENGVIRLHIPLRQKAVLSSIGVRGTEKEILLEIFPFV